MATDPAEVVAAMDAAMSAESDRQAAGVPAVQSGPGPGDTEPAGVPPLRVTLVPPEPPENPEEAPEAY